MLPPSLCVMVPQEPGGAQKCLEEAVPGACPANWLKQPKKYLKFKEGGRNQDDL